jgi:predicted AlkP superfamily pyrophosphatase or phosphodiesterase
MLPSVPKSLGRLSDAYLSAYLALSSSDNPLKLAPKKSYLVILIDGLGTANIKAAAGHAGFLNQRLKSSQSLFSGFPATTSSSLTSLATGIANGSHAVLGHRVFDRSVKQNINFLNDLGSELDPRKYQSLETISERATREGVTVSTIGTAEYEGSGFTMATMPNAQYIAAASFQERFTSAKKALSVSNSLTYLYFPELDQIAHRFGSNSRQWLEAIEELDSELAKFAKSLPSTAGVLLTADHGVIDVPMDRHIYLDEYDCFEDLEQIGGDPRVGFLYFPEGFDLEKKQKEIAESLGSVSDIVTIDQLVDSGWLAELSEQAIPLAPDLVLLPKSDRVIYHRGFAKARSLLMIGQHGGMTQAEWEVPLIIF